MTYSELLAALYQRRRRGIVLGTSRVRAALASCGLADLPWRGTVTIGGTNGKGSTAAFTAAMARAAGLRVGRFSSPHLSSLCERFEIDGQQASREDVVGLSPFLKRFPDLTFFELTFLMAARLFADAAVDLAIFEVGLGGRLDATNALDADVACVTGVALDHQEYLGTTLVDIAREKAGIFRRGRAAVVGNAGEEGGRELLEAHARGAGADPVTVVTASDVVSVPLRLGLPGRHQRNNAAAAIAIVDVLAHQGLRVPDRVRTAALQETHLPARLEHLAKDPTVIVDGAHNGHAAAALAEYLEPWRGRVSLVFGVSADKDVSAMLCELSKVVHEVICVAADDARAMPAAAVGEAARTVGVARIKRAASVAEGVAEARRGVVVGGLVAVAGSLFVASEARQHLVAAPSDPDIPGDSTRSG